MLYFDIETLPTDNASVIKELERTISPPATIKKPESITKWYAEQHDSAMHDLISKTSFDGLYGRVACIAWCLDDGEIRATGEDFSETDAIGCFFDWIAHFDRDFCGHNIHGFDLPFLRHRSIILGILPPQNIRAAFSAKPWDDCIHDTMLMWSADKQRRVSLDKLCRALGIEGKGDVDGSKVADIWQHDPKSIVDYCKEDVAKVRAVYKRLIYK